MGDINGDASTLYAPPLKSNKYSLTFDNQLVVKDSVFKIPFQYTLSDTLEGYEGTIEYDPETLELLDIEGEKNNFAIPTSGIINMSCYQVPTKDKTLFCLCLFFIKSK